MPLTAKDIIVALPLLSPAERQMVQQALGQLEGANEGPTVTAAPANDVLFEALRTELIRAGVRRTLSYDAFTKMSGYKGWHTAKAEVDSFITDAFPKLKNKTQRIGLLKFLISTLIEDMRNMNIPVTVNTVASNMTRLPEMFNSCFPNYIESGLAHLVLKSLQRRQ